MRMTQVRLLRPVRFNGFVWAAGLTLALSAPQARQLVRSGIAEYAEPEHAVVEPPETRLAEPAVGPRRPDNAI